MLLYLIRGLIPVFFFFLSSFLFLRMNRHLIIWQRSGGIGITSDSTREVMFSSINKQRLIYIDLQMQEIFLAICKLCHTTRACRIFHNVNSILPLIINDFVKSDVV